MKSIRRGCILALIAGCVGVSTLQAQVRLKDIASIQGLMPQKVTGYGLVMGLDGTGDGTRALFTIQAFANFLQRFGVAVDANRIRMRNVAAVVVTAEMSPFARVGSALDVTVSSAGDATSLEGGTLIQTPLIGPDNKPWAIAQGAVSIGGMAVAGTGGNAQTNAPLVGRIPAGGQSHIDLPLNFIDENRLTILLKNADFTSAQRVTDRINKEFEDQIAEPMDAAQLIVHVPSGFMADAQLVNFISRMEQLEIEPDVAARVVINERTGTVVVGGNVRLNPVAISHGDLSIQIGAPAQAAAPGIGGGPQNRVVVLSEQESGNIANLADALNAVEATPKDIISIFQALKQAGALNAQLTIM